jgi:hypothetical protein
VFILRSGRVTGVALVSRSVLAKPGALQAAVRLAALGRLRPTALSLEAIARLDEAPVSLPLAG